MIAQAFGLRSGLTEAKEVNLNKFIVESDAATVVYCINDWADSLTRIQLNQYSKIVAH